MALHEEWKISNQLRLQTGKRYAEEKASDEGSSTRIKKKDAKLWRKIWSINIKKNIQHFI